MKTKLLSLLAAALFVLPALVRAQDTGDLPYTSGSTGADGALMFRPSFLNGRRELSMTYDAERKQVVMFGGIHTGVWPYVWSDTWTWDGTSWTQRQQLDPSVGRRSSAMAYDSARKQVVMFGGYNDVYGAKGDTWIWDGNSWIQASPTTSPSPRYGHCMAFDAARGQIVLFGGYNGGELSETWTWDGSNWTLQSPPTVPPARRHFAMAFDSTHQQVILFGGVSGINYTTLGDTFAWNGTDWKLLSPASSPSPRGYMSMVEDTAKQQLVQFSEGETWVWDGTSWSQKQPATSPTQTYLYGFAYDAERKRVVLAGGTNPNSSDSSETWLWDGTNWQFWSSGLQVIDMAAKPDGIWNYTSISVGAGVTVRFKPNTANSPVRWKATDNVVIDGTIDLNGSNGTGDVTPGNEAPAGPGGFAGGLGGTRYDQSSSFAGTPGRGPGGGLPGVTRSASGQDAGHNGVYGNAYLQPLIGGSGGGGGASSDNANGGNGGGGGGAIFIASSRDITLNGSIVAVPGGGSGNASGGGRGSGGAIRLAADRIFGGGSLDTGGNGRIRLEAYYRKFTGPANPVAAFSPPVGGQEFNATGALTVAQVAGKNVANPPTGNTYTPDVIFTEAGEVNVLVQAQGIPDSTPVTLRITSDGTVITRPAPGEQPVLLQGGQATFRVTVPKGVGTVQASAEFTLRR